MVAHGQPVRSWRKINVLDPGNAEEPLFQEHRSTNGVVQERCDIMRIAIRELNGDRISCGQRKWSQLPQLVQ